MRHKKSGRRAIKVNFIKHVDYEVEAEALADFSYQKDKSKTNIDSKTDFLI